MSSRASTQSKNSAPQKSSVHYTWKDHPLAVAVISIASTATLSILIFSEVVIPIRTAKLENQISNLPAIEADLKNTKDIAENQRKEIDILRFQLQSLQERNLFTKNNLYPTLHGKVRIGDSLEAVEKEYPHARINKKEDNLWSVYLSSGVFNQIVFYYDNKPRKKPITHIGFVLNKKGGYTYKFLKDRIIEALGSPTSTPMDGFYEWRNIRGAEAFLKDDEMYLIMEKGYGPRYWPASP